MTIAMYSYTALLITFCFLFIYHLLVFIVGTSGVRSRLSYMKHESMSERTAAFISRYDYLYRHISDLLELTRSGWKISTFFFIVAILGFMGMLIGSFVFTSLRGVVVLSLILGLLPYLTLRMKLIGMQMRTRLEFLPAVEVFYQHYVLAGSKNVRSVLTSALEGGHMLYPTKSVFEQLQLNLSTNRELDDCLRMFSLSLGHLWADYFTSIIRFGLLEGIDVTNNLKELITDMRKAQRADQVERNRLLEIRLANFSPLVFLAIFLILNFKMNSANAYYYYLVDNAGKNMLLDALLLIFVSFLMGVYLSMKRM
jgi:hypothetical protein